jgi:hypothetical protein
VVENVYEELDTGAEFFFNESTQMLYVWPNATGGAPDAAAAVPAELHDLVVPVLQQLIATTGTQASPVKDLTIDGPSRTTPPATPRHATTLEGGH